MIVILIALHTFVSGADAPLQVPEERQSLLLLRFTDQTDADGERLREEVAVYTRDLGLGVGMLPVALPSGAPGAVTEGLALVRELGARLAFWCEPAQADGTVTLHLVDARGIVGRRLIKTTSREPAELDRTVALKLRAVLSGLTAVDAPPIDTSPSSSPEKPPRSSALARDPPPSVQGEALVHAAARSSQDSRRSRLAASIGYRFTVPLGQAPFTHALDLVGAMSIARSGELAVGTVVSGRSSDNSSGGQISVLDLPLRFGVRAVAHWDRIQLGLGAFAGAHLLEARARAADGRETDSSSFAGAGALEQLARMRFQRGFGGELRAQAELPVPWTRFWVQGVPTFDFGPRVGLTLGLIFADL